MTEATIQTGLIKGRQHRFRYRVRNAIGWSDFSDNSFVLAASKPAKPDRTYFLSFADNVLSVFVPRTKDTGGSPVTLYELWVDGGDDYSSEFRLLTTLLPNELTK
jgi:hypothetical protein